MHLAWATQIMYGFTCNEGHLDTILRNESLTFYGTSAYKPSPVTYKHLPVIDPSTGKQPGISPPVTPSSHPSPFLACTKMNSIDIYGFLKLKKALFIVRL